MNSNNFNQAEASYKSGNYVEALKSYYAALKEDSASFGSGDAGFLYYRIGNCLLKMHTFSEAAISYQKALEDTGFTSRAVAQVNLGKAQLGLGKFEDSVRSFNAALADSSYDKPYQAQMGLGNAYTKLGMIVDAGSAYRNAALDERNPNPTKALMNLGNCFMALGRPEDAIESYNAIFEFDPTQATSQKTYESLGQAFSAIGYYDEAVDAFNRALMPGNFALSAAAQADYDKALQALDARRSNASGGLAGIGDLSPVSPAATDIESSLQSNGAVSYGAGNVPTANDTGFFEATESDLVQLSKKQIKGMRKLRHTGLKIVLAIVILLIIALGVCVFGYTQGYGWPTQEAVIQNLFTANAEGSDTTQYWIGTTDEEKELIEHIMDMVAPTTSVDVIYLERSMTTSEAVVAAHLQEGGIIRYQISLERSGIGWKVSGLDFFFASEVDSTQTSTQTQSTGDVTDTSAGQDSSRSSDQNATDTTGTATDTTGTANSANAADQATDDTAG